MEGVPETGSVGWRRDGYHVEMVNEVRQEGLLRERETKIQRLRKDGKIRVKMVRKDIGKEGT